MKKVKKQCLGFFGLSLVAAMTAIAANLPVPGASATSSTVTDTLVVRVVGSVPDVNVVGIENDANYVDLDQAFSINYENVDTMSVTSTYTDKDGKVTTKTITDAVYDYVAGTANYKLSDIADEYAYGKYLINVNGVGFDGVYDEDNVLLYYLPIDAKVSIDAITGKHYVDMDYLAADDDPETPGEVAKITLNVYDESGKLIDVLSGITVNPPTKQVEIPFAANNMPSGKYRIAVLAYDTDGELLYEPLMLETVYKAVEIPDAGSPDTGGLFQNLNISKEDYLISGLIVFFVLGIVAFGVVARNKKTTPKKRRH